MSAMRVASQMMRKSRRKVGGGLAVAREGARWRQVRRGGGRWSRRVRKGRASRRRSRRMEAMIGKSLNLEVNIVGW